ncbi:uncharacterized protein N7496_005368 [Penicillium cataractarum]|uniref:Uncharacterized protein n=1 Tax=Penicillium cataractarum TaxID=2100454 RepID=A0A9W9SIM6_9EURO|nr:uncharacterized protein N7496_005368 [Penicillium cataractarum]KAJ5377959.1 hypothetical protein N7496_005368 [Penicillium cataractarum]
MEWSFAKDGKGFKSMLLQVLSRMPTKREPAVRLGAFVTGRDLVVRLGNNRQNVEAFAIRTVGDVASTPCSHCNRNKGPFSLCVTIPRAGCLWLLPP